MGETAQQVVFGLVAPVLIAAGAIGVATWGRIEKVPRWRWLIPVALAVPVAVAFFALYGWPREQWQRVAFVPVAGLIVGIVAVMTGRGVLARGGLLLVLGGLTGAAIWPIVARETWVWRILPVVATIALAALLAPLATRRAGPAVPGGLAIATAGTAAMVLISGFLKLTIPIGAGAMTLAVLTAITLRRTQLRPGLETIAVVSPLLVVAPLVAWLYMTSAGDELPAASFVLPAAAPLLLWAGETGPLRRRPAWLRVAVAWVLVAAVVAIAIALALQAAPERGEEDPMEDLYRQMMGSRTSLQTPA
ncbi:MAG: hypothetical protein HKN62_18370 [Phycisphaerales bacterium]|nr:hypothetical protein [Phycisphaerales bacterium]